MLLHLDRRGRAALLAAHVTDFESVRLARRWRRVAAREIPHVPGLVFAKAMPFVGSQASAGFGGGTPDLRRQVLLTAWLQEVDFEAFLKRPVAQRLPARACHSWWALFAVASTRGSHYGATPLSATGARDGPFAALTLGRTRAGALPRFLREGARLGPFIHTAPGLVTAYSAGVPLTGNCTVSLWESEELMLRFAYRDAAGHGDTVRRDPPILTEQLNARMRLRRLGGSWGPGTLHPDRLTRLAGAFVVEDQPSVSAAGDRARAAEGHSTRPNARPTRRSGARRYAAGP